MRLTCPIFRILVLEFFLFFATVTYGSTNETKHPIWEETWTDKLKRNLFVQYDKFARPAQHYNTTLVTVDINFIHVTVNEFKSSFTVDSWVSHTWIDEKLKWDPLDYGGINVIHVGNHEVWQPDVVLYNSATANTIEYYGDIYCLVYNDGSVLWVPPAQLIALCDFDFRLWPFDTQVCELKLGSWTHHGEQIDLKFTSGKLWREQYIHNAEWELVNVDKDRQTVVYPCCPEEYVYLRYTLTLKRNSAMYFSTLLVPLAAITYLTLVVFWIPPQSETKITVGALTTIVVSMFLLYFSTKVPLTKNPPLIVYFFSGCLCLVIVSLINSVFVINLSRRPYCKPLPRRLRLLLLSWPGKFLGLSDLTSAIESRRPMPGQELRVKLSEETAATNSMSNLSDDGDKQNIISPTKNIIHLEWILMATAIDRVVFLICVCVFAVMTIACI